MQPRGSENLFLIEHGRRWILSFNCMVHPSMAACKLAAGFILSQPAETIAEFSNISQVGLVIHKPLATPVCFAERNPST